MSSRALAWLIVGAWGCAVLRADLPRTYVSVSARSPRGRLRVAVLPFANQTRWPQGQLLLYRALLAELIRSGALDVVGEGDVRQLYIQRRIIPGRPLGEEDLRALVDRLKVDVVISGRLLRMERSRREGEPDPLVAFWIRALDPRGGRLLWSTYHRRRGSDYRRFMRFGVVRSVTALCQRMCAEVVRDWRRHGLLRGARGEAR